MKKSLFYTFAFAFTLGLTACSDGYDTYIDNVLPPIKGDSVDINPGDGNSSDDSYYRELWRPQIHYTPAKNWINAPNGMVYLNGTWHMYYQYNPSGEAWGNTSWGHATCTDLFHWKEQPVALTPDELGYIYSGSAVVDKNNTAGFGENAIVAIYTAHGNR
jgi:fructan beta-fructosidase